MSERTNVKVFIASSGELIEERRESVLILAELNKLFPHLYLEPILFEFDTESGNNPGNKRLQDKINPLLDQSDIVVVLFYSRIGLFTKEEFDRAIDAEKKIFLYIKEGFISDDPEKLQKYLELITMKKSIEEASEIRYQKFDTLINYNGLLYKDLHKYLDRKFMPELGEEKQEDIKTTSIIPIAPRPYIAHPYGMPKSFTGRVEEINSLKEWIYLDHNHPLYVLEAIGGMGKTSLTWKWLQDEIISKPSENKGIIWWSFYDQGFEDFIEHLFQYCVPEEIRIKQEKADRLKTILTTLTNQRFLIILDGFERVLRGYGQMSAMYIQEGGLSQADIIEAWDKHQRSPVNPKAERLLEGFCSGKSKVLITTRLFPSTLEDLAGVKHVKLYGLSKTDSIDFFKKENIQGSPEDMVNAAAVYGYHPLMLKLLISSINRSKTKDINEAFTKKIINQKDPQKILQTSFDVLNEDEKLIATYLSVFRTTFDFDAACTLFPDKDVDDIWSTLYELRSLGFILYNEPDEKFDFHPIMRSYLYDRLSNKENIHELAITYFQAIPPTEEAATIEELQPTIELFHHFVKAKKYDNAFSLFQNRLTTKLYHELEEYGKIYELLDSLFLNNSPQNSLLSDPDNIRSATLLIGYAYHHLGRSKEGLDFIKKHNETCTENICELHQLTIHQQQGNILYAENRSREVLKKCREELDGEGEFKALSILSDILNDRGVDKYLEVIAQRMSKIYYEELEYYDYDAQNMNWFLLPAKFEVAQKKKDIVECRKIANLICNFKDAFTNKNRYLFTALKYLAIVDIKSDDLFAAEEKYNQLIEHYITTNNQLGEYLYLVRLAKIRLKQKQTDEVIALLKEPIKYAKKDNLWELYSDCLILLAEVAKMQDKIDEAIEYAIEAYKVAWRDGYDFSFHRQLKEAEKIINELGGRIPYLYDSEDVWSYVPLSDEELNPEDKHHV